MRQLVFILALVAGMTLGTLAQNPPANPAPPRSVDQNSPDESSANATESSSKNTKIDLSPPVGSEDVDPRKSSAPSDVQEFHPWDPHKAAKAVEVGDFYLRRGNYRAAINRYQEALYWKPNDAIATFRLAQALEKTGDTSGARKNYEAYLKILPHGPYAADAQKALEKLQPTGERTNGRTDDRH